MHPMQYGCFERFLNQTNTSVHWFIKISFIRMSGFVFASIISSAPSTQTTSGLKEAYHNSTADRCLHFIISSSAVVKIAAAEKLT